MQLTEIIILFIGLLLIIVTILYLIQDINIFCLYIPTKEKKKSLYLRNNIEKSHDTYNNKVWFLNSPLFPEMCQDNNYISNIPDINKVSIAISGGGSRSFVCMMGYFRALNRMGYKNKAQYVSTVSGGSWFYGLYSYCQSNSFFTDSILLGESSGLDLSGNPQPSIITLSNLQLDNSKEYYYFGNIFSKKDIYSYMIDALEEGNIETSELWNYSIGKMFLERYGLNGDVPVALNYSHSLDILNRNPDIGQPIYLQDEMPFWICNTTLLFDYVDKYPYIIVPMTPIYSGIPQIISNNFTKAGGYLVENYAFGNTDFPDGINLEYDKNTDCPYEKVVSLKKINNIKTLRDMIGTSSTFFASIAYKTELLGTIVSALLPHDLADIIPMYNIWEYTEESSFLDLNFKKARIGDGGLCDNTGILSLLARKVKHIISFCNIETIIYDNLIKCDNTITSLFGSGKETCEMYNLSLNTIQVFEQKEYDNNVFPQFQKTFESGGPTFARANLEVLENKKYGIIGGYNVDILFILLHPSTNFENQLKPEVKEQITKLSRSSPLEYGEFNNFPNYATAFHNLKKGLIHLTQSQTNLLSSYTDWCLNQQPLRSIIEEMYSY